MNEHEQAFAEKLQRLRHTGVGGQTAPSYERFPSPSKSRPGDRSTHINMIVKQGWAVANPITKKGVSQKDAEQRAKQDGSVKVFATTNMDRKPEPKTPNPPAITNQDTEESVIKEILALQRKLAALREK